MAVVAREFGVDESAVRRKLTGKKSAEAPPVSPLRTLAERQAKVHVEQKRLQAEKVELLEEIAELPANDQLIVADLARQLTNISRHLGSAAEYSAASAHRLAGLARTTLDKVDDVDPLSTARHLKAFASLQILANKAGELPTNLLRANKDLLDADAGAEAKTAPSGLGHFYGEDDEE